MGGGGVGVMMGICCPTALLSLVSPADKAGALTGERRKPKFRCNSKALVFGNENTKHTRKAVPAVLIWSWRVVGVCLQGAVGGTEAVPVGL